MTSINRKTQGIAKTAQTICTYIQEETHSFVKGCWSIGWRLLGHFEHNRRKLSCTLRPVVDLPMAHEFDKKSYDGFVKVEGALDYSHDRYVVQVYSIDFH